MHVDENVPGAPLYQINLDRFKYKQTYVKMTTDALLCYQQMQPLAHVPSYPNLKLKMATVEAKKPADPFYSKSNMAAALAIQRTYRMHRSRRIAARKRYEAWQRTASSFNSIIHHLTDANAMSRHGHAMVRRYMQYHPVLYLLQGRSSYARQRRDMMTCPKLSEVSHSFISPRFLCKLKKSNETNQLQEEYNVKYKQRLLFLQNCAAAAVGNEPAPANEQSSPLLQNEAVSPTGFSVSDEIDVVVSVSCNCVSIDRTMNWTKRSTPTTKIGTALTEVSRNCRFGDV